MCSFAAAYESTQSSLRAGRWSGALGNRIGNTVGRVAGIMNPPERGVISDLACGGKNLDWLYLAERGRLFRRSKSQARRLESNEATPAPVVRARNLVKT
jgi:hypothetical protein